MADLAASDITVTLPRGNMAFLGGRVWVRCTLTFGDGALTYPTGGIPMPAIGNFGMRQAIENVFVEQPANGNNYHYDITNNKLRAFTATATEMSGAVAAHTLKLLIVGQ